MRALGRVACAALILLAGCDRSGRAPEGTVVIAAVGEPAGVLPPLTYETVARDIGDLVYERLAYLEPGGAPIDTSAYEPGLAESWERVDSRTWRFQLRPDAHWHDGWSVTADDVVFSFETFADSAVDALARPWLADRVTAIAEDSFTVLLRFASPSPEQLYDATSHVRIIPRHIWDAIPIDQWAADTALAHLVGSGPYRVAEWRRGESLVLEADTTRAASLRPGIARVVWRFADDPDAALNLILSGDADLMEAIGTPDRVSRVEADSAFAVRTYPAAVYGFLGFRLADSAGRAHPLLGDRAVRRGLASAVNRNALAQNVYGPGAHAPAGPMSALLWVGEKGVTTLPYDTAAAAGLLDSAGWPRGTDGMRSRRGTPLAFDILVPATSPARRQLAVALQETWRQAGARVTVTAVDFPVFLERIAAGRFDSYIGAYLDEPSPRGLADQWSRAGFGVLNHGRYASTTFDSLLASAGQSADTTAARRLYHQALTTLNADAPAIFLYTPLQAAAISRQLDNATIDPYSWLGTLPEWKTVGGRR